MDKKDFYRIMGLSFLEGPVLQELIKDGANPDFAEDIEKLRNKADEVYEEVNKNPVGVVDGTLDDKMYELTQAISAMTSYTLDLIPLELPRDSSIGEERFNNYKQSIDDAKVLAQYGFRKELREELENHPEVKKYVEEERKIQEQKEQELRREEEEKERQREQKEREQKEKENAQKKTERKDKWMQEYLEKQEELKKEEEEQRRRKNEDFDRKKDALEEAFEKLEEDHKKDLKKLEEEKKAIHREIEEERNKLKEKINAQKEKYEAESKQKDLEWENEKKAFKEAADQRTKEYVESDAVKADIKRQLEEIKNRVEQKTKEETLKNSQEVPAAVEEVELHEEINNVAKQAAESLKNRPEGIDKRQLEELINRAKQQVEETLKNRQEASADVEKKVEQQFKEINNRVKQANEANKERREEVEKELIATKFSPKGLFDNNINKLVGARTRVNSREYDELIKIVSNINNGAVRNNGTYTPREAYVVQLLAIKSSINNYLNHKAAKGVKQNSFKKLDAVEELNAEVTRRVQEVTCDTLNHKGKPVNITAAPLTYDDEKKAFTKKYKNSEIKTPERMGEKALNECVNKAKANYPDANADTMGRVDDCMCRILLASYKGGKVGRHSKEINEMRKQFREHPDNIKYTERKENKQKEQKKQGVIKK